MPRYSNGRDKLNSPRNSDEFRDLPVQGTESLALCRLPSRVHLIQIMVPSCDGMINPQLGHLAFHGDVARFRAFSAIL